MLVHLEYRLSRDFLVDSSIVRSRIFKLSGRDAAERAENPAQTTSATSLLESTNGRVGLHVSFIVKTHFCHAPESHACLSEVGKTRQQSFYLQLAANQLTSYNKHEHPAGRPRNSTPLHHML